MKTKIKVIISSLLVVMLSIMFVGCSSSNTLLDYANKQGLDTTSTADFPKDGTNGIDGKDGKDGDTINLYEIYQQLVELGQFDGEFKDFVKEYLNSDPSTTTANKAVNSVVSVFSGFTSTITYSTGYFDTAEFEQKYYGAGAGVIFRLDKTTGDALIITNYHVCYDNSATPQISSEISLFLYGNEEFSIVTENSVSDGWNTYKYQNLVSDNKISAKYLGGSMLYDIAVLKVTGSEILKNSNAEPAHFANSDEISVGETAIAVGNPSGAGISITQGIVSVDSEYISMIGVDNATTCQFRVIRTDTAINGGNSGGGLFNSNGELIGIVNAKITSSSIENIGYAIPSNVAEFVAKNIIRNCNGEDKLTVQRCMLGISLKAEYSSATSKYTENGYKTEIVETVTISTIDETSIVKDKLAVGDIVKSVTINYSNGTFISKDITRTFHLIDLSLTISAGDSITLYVADSTGTDKSPITVTFTSDNIVEYK